MKVNLRLFTALACAAVMAASFGQGQGGGRARQGRVGRNAVFTLSTIVQRADVQADIKVTDDEKTKLEALRPQRGQRGAGGAGGNGGGAGGGAARGQRGAALDPAALAARRAEEKKTLEGILTADQMKRLGEILIQMQGDQAVGDPDVQTAINFTDDQKTKLKDLTAKYQDANRSLMEKVRNQEIDQQAARDAFTTNQKTLTDEIHKILTPDQISKLKEMGGAPFTRQDPPRRGGGK